MLRDVYPASWGVYKDPINFHLHLMEITQIEYAHDSLTVVLATRKVEEVDYRGDVLAQFVRERTKRRFLQFMKKKDVKLVKTTR